MLHFHRVFRQVLSATLLAVLVVGALPWASWAAPAAPSSGDVWYDVDESDLPVAGERWIVPQSYRTVGLDVAATEFFNDGVYTVEGKAWSAEKLTDYFADLVANYPIVTI